MTIFLPLISSTSASEGGGFVFLRRNRSSSANWGIFHINLNALARHNIVVYRESGPFRRQGNLVSGIIIISASAGSSRQLLRRINGQSRVAESQQSRQYPDCRNIKIGNCLVQPAT